MHGWAPHVEAGYRGGSPASTAMTSSTTAFIPARLRSVRAPMCGVNTVFTPHIGARTERSLAGMNAVVEDVIAVLSGDPPRYPAST